MTAQVAAPEPSSRSQEFAPVVGGGESTSAGLLLVVAYLVMWALLLGFLGPWLPALWLILIEKALGRKG